MKCPRCNGTGKIEKHYSYDVGCWGHKSGTQQEWCSLCDGTGKVVYVKSNDIYSCSKCYGTGTVREDVYDTFSTGRQIHKGYKDVKCSECHGSGKVKGKKVDYYRPDYKNEDKSCFVTTATCKFLEIADSTSILNDFRAFRDTWLANQHNGNKYIEQYYLIAPEVVRKINNSQNKKTIYYLLWNNFLYEIHQNILIQKNHNAFYKYLDMLAWLKNNELY